MKTTDEILNDWDEYKNKHIDFDDDLYDELVQEKLKVLGE